MVCSRKRLLLLRPQKIRGSLQKKKDLTSVLISNYAEPESFEAFVPNGWEGGYKDFSNKIPINQQYWIDGNGKNLIAEKG